MRTYLGETATWVRLTMMFILMTLLCLGPQSTAAQTDPAANRMVRDANYGALPLVFIPNQGQFDSKVAYAIQGRDKSIYFTAEGLTFVLSEQVTTSTASTPRKLREIGPQESHPQTPQQRWTVKLDFVDANPEVRPESLEQAETLISYFKGRPEEWRTGLQASAKIIYRDLWPGIDLIYSGTVNRLKYDFIIHPGADPARIRLACRGADSLRVTPAGRLEMETPLGTIQDEIPVAWQEQNGKRENVSVAYSLNGPAGVRVAALATQTSGSKSILKPDTQALGLNFGFTVGEYDRSQTLILDPAVFIYCGFLGGSREEYGHAIAVDSSGNAYVTGITLSTWDTFPEKVGPDLVHNGDNDAFVAKVSPSGALVYCGYIGGSGSDGGNGIAVDGSGNAYVTGSTSSTQATFPETVGPDLTFNGKADAFVAKVSPSGALVYCGYIGGSGSDYSTGIAVDSSGNAYVHGTTESTQATFPVKVGPDLTYNYGEDAFIAKVNASGSGLVYCGYIGGSEIEESGGIAVDSAGNAYITGTTYSTETTFPVKVGPDVTFNGVFETCDAFVSKVNPSGTGFVYSGYIGGTSWERGFGIAVNKDGNAYVTGEVFSTTNGFPLISGPDLTSNSDLDAYVAKIKRDGTGFLYCGYLGGSDVDQGKGIAVDGAGNAYVIGITRLSEITIPVLVGPDLTPNGPYYDYDAFVAKISDVAEGTDDFPWELFLPGILQGAKK